MEPLKTLVLNTESGEFKVNGNDYSYVDEFSLQFANGVISLSFRCNYFADGKKIQPRSENTADSKIDDDINCLISKAQKGDIESLKTIKKIVNEKN